MISITGIYQRGAVVLDAPVDLPDGVHVRVTLDAAPCADANGHDLCMDGRPWPQTPQEIQEWLAWFDALDPILTDAEYRQYEEARLERRQEQKTLNQKSWEEIDRTFR